MTSILLLSNQLLDPTIIKSELAKVNLDTNIHITIYEPSSFYKIYGQPVSNTKKRYFKTCLSNYVHKHHCKVITDLKQLKGDPIHFFDPLDKEIEEEIFKLKTTMIKHNTPTMLISSIDRLNYSKSGSFVFAAFYKHFRQRLNIFPKPVGGKWSYDDQNQSGLPKNIDIPKVDKIEFPTTREASLKWLDSFAKHKLAHFGKYQDAISTENLILWHAGISPMLNMGLILPIEVLKKIPHSWPKDKISSYEGFLRQLFWREYMCMVYYADIPIKNIFHSNVNLPQSWFDVKVKEITGLKIIDQKIIQAIEYGYLHHIERLMLVGNFMLIAQIKPIDVYKWFMCLFVDAHHWVMHANVYHMLLWCSGRVTTQRPYIASSTYLYRMIDNVDKEDLANWDKIYAKFILRNIGVLSKTYLISGHIKKAKLIAKQSKKIK